MCTLKRRCWLRRFSSIVGCQLALRLSSRLLLLPAVWRGIAQGCGSLQRFRGRRRSFAGHAIEHLAWHWYLCSHGCWLAAWCLCLLCTCADDVC